MAHADVVMEPEGRFYTFDGPGLAAARAGWQAVIRRDGREWVLRSSDTSAVAVATSVLRFPEAEVELLFRAGSTDKVAALVAQAGIRNVGSSPFELVSLTPVDAEIRVQGAMEDWLLTGLHSATPVLISLKDVQSPLVVHEHGGCYRSDGAGFLFGPTGEPVAYVNACFSPARNGAWAMRLVADMSGVRVDPREERWGQEVGLFMASPQIALPRWVERVAQSHGARTDKGGLMGWNNAHPLKKIDVRKEVSNVIASVRQSNGRLRPDLIQIGDSGITGVRSMLDAPWVSDCAQQVKAIGARFGVRLDFDATADKAEVTGTVCRAVQKGFTYLKITHPTAEVAREAKRTTFEACRDEFTAIRRAVGEDVYVCYGGAAPNRAVVGLVDASRVGRDATREDLRAQIDDVLRSYPLCGQWYAADFDNYYLGTWRQNYSQVAGGWLLTRTWLSIVGLSGGAAITSDPWYEENFKGFWRNTELLTPPQKQTAEVLDLCTSREWPRLVRHGHREWGDWTMALLWNPTSQEQRIKLDFAQAGLDPQKRYAVWTFWDNRLQNMAKGSQLTHSMVPSDLQLLRITEIDPQQSKPVLIGSNLHISSGDSEIKSIRAGRSAMTIELTDAGAREGYLFVHSRFPPVLKHAAGCEVSGLAIVGENVWQLHVNNRQLSAPQRIEMTLLLPLTRQIWFWVMMVTVLVSLFLAVWRYIVGLQIQHQRALADERTRIAQDLHDDLGATLSQIAYHGDSLLAEPGLFPAHAAPVMKMRALARTMTQSLDEIVWAVDPGRDTLESLVGYLGSFAQEMLSQAEIKCRFMFPSEMPSIHLPSKVRHHVFLAFKEAIHNIVRHASAAEVKIQLIIHSKTCELVIADNGCGFHPAAAGGRSRGGHGLANLRKRMADVGGQCNIHSRPRSGTEVRLTWRINQ